MFDAIGFDADDTLWHNEPLYATVQDQLKDLLGRWADAPQVECALLETETRNIDLYGYGIKSFALSMIETAISLSQGQVPATDIARIIDWAQEMLVAPVRMLDGARAALDEISRSYALILITKGDLRDQRAKLRRSGLTGYFWHVEVVADKTPETYRAVLERLGVAPERFMMVGNSLRSDVLPLLAIGAHAVHIPYHITWAHETVKLEHGAAHYVELTSLSELPDLLSRLAASGSTHTDAAHPQAPDLVHRPPGADSKAWPLRPRDCGSIDTPLTRGEKQ